MARSPMNEETRAKARELFAAGTSRNRIARELDLDPATVTRWAQSEGLEFDRSETEMATRARTIDLAEARVRLAQKMVVAAEDMLDRLDAPFLVYNFGGKDNTYVEHVLESAPVEVVRNAVTTAGIAFDKVTRIVEKDNGGLEGTLGVLDALAGNLAAAAERLRAEGETPAGDADAP